MRSISASMTVNSYLSNLAVNAVLSPDEKTSIDRSITALHARLSSYFGSNISAQFRFGSSTRGTILPRRFDERSDIDYMIVFRNGGFQPQTYLNQLRRFVDAYYSRSNIKQSSPTIILELNHIKFDLVPALPGVLQPYKIPDKDGAWQGTDPNDFNADLSRANQQNKNFIKPAIRLAKIWNARAGYVFDSFELEKEIAGSYYLVCNSLRDYLFAIINDFSTIGKAQWKQHAITRAKRIVSVARQRERDWETKAAENVTARLFFP